MKKDKASQEFIESMGLIYQAEGLPRIAGRIVGFLTITDEAFSLQDLADSLEVSRASISTNTRLLEQFGMIERIAKSGDRQGFYQLAPEAYSVALTGATQRMIKAKRVISKAIESVPKSAKGAHKNFADLARFYEITIEGMEEIVRKYSDGSGK